MMQRYELFGKGKRKMAINLESAHFSLLSPYFIFCKDERAALCVGKHLSVVEGNLELGVFAVEIVLQAV